MFLHACVYVLVELQSRRHKGVYELREISSVFYYDDHIAWIMRLLYVVTVR